MEEEQRNSTGRVDGQAARGPSSAADRPGGSAPLGGRARRATSLAGCGTPAAAGARLRALPSSSLAVQRRLRDSSGVLRSGPGRRKEWGEGRR